MRTLEEVLVEQCAPTLARVKPASMFRYQPRDLKAEPLEQALEKLPALRDMLAARGIRVRILKNCPKTETLLFFVFRTELCGRILEDRAVRAFLRAGGYDAIAFGCPAMGDEVLEEAEFEPMFADVEGALGGKKVALFGSYGWGDGQWMRDWVERCRNAGANLIGEGLILNGTPDADGEAQCFELGKQIAG